MHDLIHSNLPTSFDVTPLLSKLEHLEDDPTKGNSIQRVKLIELDPYYQQTTNDKTRLLLAVAFGKNAVVAQLIALELGHVRDDNDNYYLSTGEGGLDVEEELEWIDVSSDDRVLPREGSQADGIGAAGDPVVVFPPSRADSLPSCVGAQKSRNGVDGDDGNFTSDITSCALIPSPAVRTVCPTAKSTSKIITQRSVAVMLGTSHDQVLSLLLNVSGTGTNPDTPSMENNIRFVLEYDECKFIENGVLKELGDKTINSFATYPCVRQILPRAKRFGPDSDIGEAVLSNDGKEDKDNDSFDSYNNSNEHVQVFHPSLQSSSPQQDVEGDERKEVKYSGIKSISFCRDNLKSKGYGLSQTMSKETIMNQDIIWITHGNGTIVKLPSWRPFLAFETGSKGDDVLDCTDIPSNGSAVIPLNTPFQSPLDVPPPQPDHRQHSVSPSDEIESTTQCPNTNEYWNLLSSAVSSQDPSQCHWPTDTPINALVLAGQSAPASTLPIAFNSSRVKCNPSPSLAHEGTFDSSENWSPLQQGEQGSQSYDGHEILDMSSEDEHYGPGTGAVVEGTATLVKGALGMALGAVRWGFGVGRGVDEERGNFDEDDTPLDEFMDIDDTIDEDAINHGMNAISEKLVSTRKMDGPFTKKGGVQDLFPWPLSSASFPFSDIPRRFETATVDPSGSLVATTDNLGRVILFDLETNQPIRMWKGMRNVSCYFAELPCYSGRNKETGISTRSYLVIHLRQRGAVEVYRLQQGPRVSAVAVPQQKDCVVVQCQGPPSEGSRVGTFLLERIDASDENHCEGCHYVIDGLVIDDPDIVVATTLPKQTPVRPTSQSENKMQLRLLMQLLAPDTNIQCTAQTVLTTFQSIQGLADLGEGLDVLSKCSRLEGEMGIDGSSLHSQAVSYCQSRLNHATQQAQEGSGMVRKAQISELNQSIAYHNRLVHAYNVLHRYERQNDLNSASRDDPESRDNVETLSPWASEALSWISAASGNDASKTRFMPSFPDAQNQGTKKPLEFFKFAMSCRSNGDNDRVYLTKVKRSRVPILMRAFHPLLQDLFVFKVVNSLFDNLGLGEDFDTQQQYFGEWVSSLPTHDIVKSNMSGTWHPMIRWLRDLILSAYDMSQEGQHKLGDEFLRKTARLESLMKFCMEMEDLPKAFLLSVICMDAVSSANLQLEQKTYGKITQLESVRPWEDLLRKLRVCLLVSLRLAGDVNPFGGVDPMTVNSVSRPDTFSTFSWIARDELSLSHDNQVVMALESACLSSSAAFYPSTADGDRSRHKKTMFQSCSSPRQLATLHNPTGLTNDTHARSLLFYLKEHARFTTHLAANRALILASMWGQAPQNLDLLKHAISALQIVVDRVEGFSLATIVEIYQSRIRPVCRAMLFGFGEHELSEETFSPLIEDQDWSREFITASKRILVMIIALHDNRVFPPVNTNNNLDSRKMWPPLRECPILFLLAKKLHNVHLSSVELTHTVLFAFEMTRNIDSLESAVPSFTSLFLIGSLFSETPPLPKGSAEQRGLLDRAILDHAATSSSPVIDNFSCIEDVELFGKSLGLDAKYARTQYLIEMIRLGKDASIDDLLGSSISSLDKVLFTEKVVQIICGRLHATILSLKQTKSYRGILSLLDADASRWVREEALRGFPSEKNNYAIASLITTHSLVMRVQSMSDDSMSEKIEALCLMSGTLLKAVQAHEQDAVMNI
mmetsp:Transcript_22582/g.48884  ORF Transcript_22582/g.48884 Transcript_22582/m.48884 type:complete len:1696 (-) Transcript_22582:1217-6304(-)|eukprot:CAMPEP_0172306998 /NCGR_PEP_ID=MMETSP1058-20130122/7943_1 /TAXON_ID=83371 /ORGANISM="Detonula confervacea, Strain CCMP 353" /LENGTH=1695 /DNA_ID=CAMNT_0013019055 /DNA_START=2610 /DNA_END=7697 /DNA_ORIENTATION=-